MMSIDKEQQDNYIPTYQQTQQIVVSSLMVHRDLAGLRLQMVHAHFLAAQE